MSVPLIHFHSRQFPLTALHFHFISISCPFQFSCISKTCPIQPFHFTVYFPFFPFISLSLSSTPIHFPFISRPFPCPFHVPCISLAFAFPFNSLSFPFHFTLTPLSFPSTPVHSRPFLSMSLHCRVHFQFMHFVSVLFPFSLASLSLHFHFISLSLLFPFHSRSLPSFSSSTVHIHPFPSMSLSFPCPFIPVHVRPVQFIYSPASTPGHSCPFLSISLHFQLCPCHFRHRVVVTEKV